MEKIFIIGKNVVLIDLKANTTQLPTLENEEQIHDWVINKFKNSDFEKVIIEIGENPILSLQIGYHIRLSMNELNIKSLMPILFVSNLSLDFIIYNCHLYSHILSTKGVYFTELGNIETLKAEVDLIEALSDSEYLTRFLKIINILPDETIGRHSLANIWGAYSMDKAANTNALPADAKFKKTLYFKYISAFNNLDKLKSTSLKIIGAISVGNADVIDAKDKRILLIDDEADKGWETVLRKVFKVSGSGYLTVIKEKVSDFDSFSSDNKKIIEENNFDLYLVDLRLNGLEEEENLNPEDFSGMKVLKKIKSLNQGNQAIIFTASNKAWNLEALLDARADGYYIKESPEYNFSRTFSEQNYKNFKSNVQKCFERIYLRDIYEIWKSAIEVNKNQVNVFTQESNSMLDIAWNLIQQEHLDFGYLTLFQIIELYANQKYDYRDNSIEIEGVKNFMIEKNEDNEIWKLTFNDSNQRKYFFFGEEQKMKGKKVENLFKASCVFAFLFKKDNNFLEEFGSLNKLRHKIAHEGAKGQAKKENTTIIKYAHPLHTYNPTLHKTLKL